MASFKQHMHRVREIVMDMQLELDRLKRDVYDKASFGSVYRDMLYYKEHSEYYFRQTEGQLSSAERDDPGEEREDPQAEGGPQLGRVDPLHAGAAARPRREQGQAAVAGLRGPAEAGRRRERCGVSKIVAWGKFRAEAGYTKPIRDNLARAQAAVQVELQQRNEEGEVPVDANHAPRREGDLLHRQAPEPPTRREEEPGVQGQVSQLQADKLRPQLQRNAKVRRARLQQNRPLLTAPSWLTLKLFVEMH